MQSNLKLGHRYVFNFEKENTADFIWSFNSNGFYYHIPGSVTIRIVRKDGTIFFDGRLWDLYQFQQTYVGEQQNINNVWRHMSSYKYDLNYFSFGNADSLRIQFPEYSTIELDIADKTFTSGFLSQYVNFYRGVVEVGDLLSRNIRRVELEGNQVFLPKGETNFIMCQPQYKDNLTTAFYMPFSAYFAIRCDEFLGYWQEDCAARLYYNFVQQNMLNEGQTAYFKGKYHNVSFEVKFAGNFSFYPYAIYFV